MNFLICQNKNDLFYKFSQRPRGGSSSFPLRESSSRHRKRKFALSCFCSWRDAIRWVHRLASSSFIFGKVNHPRSECDSGDPLTFSASFGGWIVALWNILVEFWRIFLTRRDPENSFRLWSVWSKSSVYRWAGARDCAEVNQQVKADKSAVKQQENIEHRCWKLTG